MNFKVPFLTLIFHILIAIPCALNSESKPINFSIPVKASNELKILTWNIYMLPHCNIINKNKKRARAIAEKLSQLEYDIILFEEAFDYRARRIIRNALNNKYPFIYGPANESFFSLRTNSGLWVLSKVPLTHLKEIEYKSRFGIDAMARKGAAMFEGNWTGNAFQIIVTHLQADSPDEVRRQQCGEIAAELLDKFSRKNVPQFVCGDFNIEMDDIKNYNYMLSALHVENGKMDGDLSVSYDEIDNHLARRENGKKRLIDYILLRNHDEKISTVMRRISVLKSKINEFMETDLSDHYGIEATILFRQ